MSKQTGEAEYAELVAAFDHTRPACRDDWRYIQDREDIDEGDLAQMRRLCRNVCPLAEMCSAYAETARPAAGMWAGRYWGRKERSKS